MNTSNQPRRTAVASPEEDPNLEVRGYASPPCLMHELEPAWQPVLDAREQRALVGELLAGARTTARLLTVLARRAPRPTGAARLLEELAAAERGAVRRLCAALRELGEAPEAAARPPRVEDPPQAPAAPSARAVLRFQADIARRLCEALPRVADPSLRTTLGDLLALHEQGVERCRRLVDMPPR